MLDMGFADDLEPILGGAPASARRRCSRRRSPRPIARLAERHLRDPVRVARPGRARGGRRARRGVRQVAYVVRRADKLAALGRILDLEDPPRAGVRAHPRRGRRARRGADAAAATTRRRSTAGCRRSSATGSWAASATARSTSWSRPTSPRAAWTSSTSPRRELRRPVVARAYVHRIGRTGPGRPRGRRDHARRAARAPAAAGHRADDGAAARDRRLPTVADLRERRLDLLRATLRETLLADGLDRYRAVVESLSEEFDLVDIALAAISQPTPGRVATRTRPSSSRRP